MPKKKNRSDRYQQMFNEIAYNHEMMSDMPEAAGMPAWLNSYTEEMLDLKEQLRDEFWRLVDEELTPRQKEVVHLYADGLTQTEIAKKLGVNQSSVTKSLNGNCDYRNGKKVYGGAKKKLGRLVQQDPRIQEILARIGQLVETN